jgi:carbamoyl-phosphate synthase large subunit
MDGSGIGEAFVSEFSTVPGASHSDYLGAVASLCRRWGIDVVVPGSEPEIWAMGTLSDPPLLHGTYPVICQSRSWVDSVGDKLLCMEMLAGTVEVAPFADGENREAVDALVRESGFPLVVKPRRSSGSRGIRVAHDQGELEQALREITVPLVQVFLDESGGEFSVGVFRSQGLVTAVAFRRTLGPVGCSWFAETCNDPDVLQYALAVSETAELTGSANVQVRKTQHGVRLLEVNPRFSSLVAARAACGFADLEWSIRLALGFPIPGSPVIRPLRFQRFFHEMVDYGSGFHAMTTWSPRTSGATVD